MNNLKKISAILVMFFLLNSCFWYKLVKEEGQKEVENTEEKTTYEPWSLWAILHRDEINKQEEEQQKENIEDKDNDEKKEENKTKDEEEKKDKIKKEEEKKKEDKKEKKEEKTEKIKEKSNFDYSDLSKIPEFGEAVVRWNGVVSKVNYNLFVEKEDFDNIDGQNFKENPKEFFSYHDDEDTRDLTKYIRDKYNVFYWNTARTFPNEAGFTFFVIHAQWKNYIYEKHYVDLKNKLHWILFLDKWPLEKAENLWEKLESLKAKNKELKEMNANFSEINTTNMVFKKLLK